MNLDSSVLDILQNQNVARRILSDNTEGETEWSFRKNNSYLHVRLSRDGETMIYMVFSLEGRDSLISERFNLRFIVDYYNKYKWSRFNRGLD